MKEYTVTINVVINVEAENEEEAARVAIDNNIMLAGDVLEVSVQDVDEN